MAEQARKRERSLARFTASLLSPSRARGRLVVFSYHQVLNVVDPLRSGEPDADQFRKDVELIDRVFTVLPFGEAAQRLSKGKLPSRAASITFDDGYANNYEVAAPILNAAGVPATFFIACGAVEQGVMWNDLVIESVAHSSSARSPESVSEILATLKYKPMVERWDAAVRLYRAAVSNDLPRLMMTSDMVASLHKKGFEIGGHTINHPILAVLSDGEARSEIEGCAEWLEGVTGTRPTTFAYPNGIPGQDFDGRHEAMATEAGFHAAASTHWGVARPGANLLSLPRIGPWWRQGQSLETGLIKSYLKSYLR